MLVKKLQKNCSVQDLKIIFGIQCFFRIFWHISRIQKSHPIYGCAWKFRWSCPSVRCGQQIFMILKNLDRSFIVSLMVVAFVFCLRIYAFLLVSYSSFLRSSSVRRSSSGRKFAAWTLKMEPRNGLESKHKNTLKKIAYKVGNRWPEKVL